MPHFSINTWVCDDLIQPFGDANAKNSYLCFQGLVGRNGVYIFQDKATGAVLYIGEAHSQDLKQRITQNFAPNDTGGTFRKDWCDKEKKEFTQFKEALQHWLIRAILIETESKDLIRAIEETFISELKPKYNKFVGRPSVG